MGKSTTAQMFVDQGCALWDADAAVHRLYAAGGLAVAPISEIFPTAIMDNAVSREELKKIIAGDSSALKMIERIVHPLVALDRKYFLSETQADIAVLDIPLLFETGTAEQMDAVACVTIPFAEQKNRVLARGTMTEDQFLHVREKQMSNDKKCALADYVIVTDTLEHAHAQVQTIVQEIREKLIHAGSGSGYRNNGI